MEIAKLGTLIYVVRGQTGALNKEETQNWISRNVISNPGLRMGLWKFSYAFT